MMVKPGKDSYEDENELGDEFCSSVGCSSCMGIDQDGEPYGYGCQSQDDWLNKWEHLIEEEL